jgi:hypothetical protein
MNPISIQTPKSRILALLLVSVSVVPWAACGQAILVFSNRVLGSVDAPFYDVDCVTRLAGSGYRAALFIGPPGSPENAMVPLGNPQPFRTGASAGYWESANLALPFPPGTVFQAQVRFWETRGDTVRSFQQALQEGVRYGFSSVLRLTVNAFGNTTLTGLRSACLILPIRLELVAVGEQTMEARWPATATQFRLETSDPQQPGLWQPVTGVPVRSNDSITLRLSIQEPQALYRLRASLQTNQPPTLSELMDQTAAPGGVVGPLAFNVGDAETPANELLVVASSSNPALVPNSSIVLAGAGAQRTVTVTPAAGQHGSVTITVVVTDGVLSASTDFSITVP